MDKYVESVKLRGRRFTIRLSPLSLPITLHYWSQLPSALCYSLLSPGIPRISSAIPYYPLLSPVSVVSVNSVDPHLFCSHSRVLCLNNSLLFWSSETLICSVFYSLTFSPRTWSFVQVYFSSVSVSSSVFFLKKKD